MQEQREVIAYHAMSPQDALRMLGTSRTGLSSADATARHRKHGPNALPRPKRTGPFGVFIRQFGGPIMVVLLAAFVVALSLRQIDDAVLIALVIMLHAVLGFFQEYRADRAFEQLSAYLPQRAHVLRNGVPTEVAAEDVVVGDILLIESGMRAVADARLIVATACEVNEAALTGESAPVAKDIVPVAQDAALADRADMLFAGTTIAGGRGQAVVTAIGAQTELGRITTMTAALGRERTPLEEQLAVFSRQLLFIVLTVVAIVFAWGVGKGIPLAEMLVLGIALAVAAIPEGLLITLTVILALGMQRMVRRRALVRTLVAAETLGGVTVICADKTGTMTRGDMTVTELFVGESRVAPEDVAALPLLTHLSRVNAAQKMRTGAAEMISGSSTERALFTFLEPLSHRLPAAQPQLVAELPFSSTRKFAGRLFRMDGRVQMIALGAPDVLLARVDCTDAERGMLLSRVEQMSGRGLRVLMVVEREAPQHEVARLVEEDVTDMRVVGLIGLDDAVRSDVPATVAEAARAGIRTLMLTGDHPRTARAVAAAVGIPEEDGALMTGVELARLDDATLAARIGSVSVFARIRPEDKLRIVRALQAGGQVVAMTGDGVNDAPALRAADVGIAVGSGTDVAKEAADIVLLDDNFTTIVAAVREGRGLFDNIRKVVVYLMTGSGSELVLILTAIAFGLPLPLLPVHILWINVLDGFPGIALAAERPEPGVMREPPRPRGEHIMRGDMLATTLLAGLVMDGVLVLMLVLLSRAGVDEATVRTFIYVTLGLTSTLYIFALRSFRRSLFAISLFSNRWLFGTVAMSMVLLFLPVFVTPLREVFGLAPLPLYALPFLVVLAVVKVIAIETAKFMLVPPHQGT